MSDWDDDMYDDEEEEELSFEEEEDLDSNDGSGDESLPEDANNSEADETDLEAQYFWGKELRQDEKLDEALAVFDKIIGFRADPQQKNNEYVFKAIKQAIKVATELSKYDEILEYLDIAFQHLPNVSHSYGDSSLSKILYRFEHQMSNCTSDFLKQFYDKFLRYLETKGPVVKNSLNERLLIRINIGKAGVLIEEHNYQKALELLHETELMVMEASESIKNVFLLDVLALEMIVATELNFNLPELTRLTTLANQSTLGIPQSRIVGIIKECSGLVEMYSEDFRTANSFFQDSFKGFNECGDDRRVGVLTKFIVSNLLSESEINPFKSSDFQGFTSQPEIAKLMDLYNAVQDTDIEKYNRLISHDEQFGEIVKKDQFLTHFLPFVTELAQIRFIIKYLGLFKKVRFERLCKKLDVGPQELEKLLLRLYHVGKISGVKIDLVERVIERDQTDGDLINPELDAAGLLRNLQLLRQCDFDFSGLEEEYAVLQQQDDRDHEAADNYENRRLSEALISHLQGDTLPESPANISKPDLYLAPLLIKKKILEPLFPVGTSKDWMGGKSCDSIGDLLKELSNYLQYMKASVPTAQNQTLSHLEKIKKDNLDTEFQKLSELQSKDTGAYETDTNLKEVLQTTTMSSLEIGSGENDTDAKVPTREELFAKKLGSLVGLFDEITSYNDRLKIHFKTGLRAALSDERQFTRGIAGEIGSVWVSNQRQQEQTD